MYICTYIFIYIQVFGRERESGRLLVALYDDRVKEVVEKDGGEVDDKEEDNQEGNVTTRTCAHPNISDTDVRLVGMPFQHDIIVLSINFNMFFRCN
jgi:hypothetical protein